MLLNAGFGSPKNGQEDPISKPILYTIVQMASPQTFLGTLAPLWQEIEKLESSSATQNLQGLPEDEQAEEEIVTNDEGTEPQEPLEPAILVAKKHELNQQLKHWSKSAKQAITAMEILNEIVAQDHFEAGADKGEEDWEEEEEHSMEEGEEPEEGAMFVDEEEEEKKTQVQIVYSSVIQEAIQERKEWVKSTFMRNEVLCAILERAREGQEIATSPLLSEMGIQSQLEEVSSQALAALNSMLGVFADAEELRQGAIQIAEVSLSGLSKGNADRAEAGGELLCALYREMKQVAQEIFQAENSKQEVFRIVSQVL